MSLPGHRRALSSPTRRPGATRGCADQPRPGFSLLVATASHASTIVTWSFANCATPSRSPKNSTLVAQPSGCASLAHRCPSRSRPLERDLGTRLFDRDRRSVTLTPDGRLLLPRTVALLEDASELHRATAGLSSAEPVQPGYANWRPSDLITQTAGVAQLHVDAWVLPPHTRPAGSLTAASTWPSVGHVPQTWTGTGCTRGCLAPTGSTRSADPVAWLSWNAFGEEFAADIGDNLIPIDEAASPARPRLGAESVWLPSNGP